MYMSYTQSIRSVSKHSFTIPLSWDGFEESQFVSHVRIVTRRRCFVAFSK